MLYVVVICIPIRLHQSDQAHSTTCLAFLVCKYQGPYFILFCSLQHVNMHVQWFYIYIYIYSAVLDERWSSKENWNYGQEFLQYQQNEQAHKKT